MCFDTRRIVAHIDRFAGRLPSCKPDSPLKHSRRCGIHFKIRGRLLLFLCFGSLLLRPRSGTTAKNADQAEERRQTTPPHFESPSRAVSGGPAFAGRSPVSDSRNATRSERSSPESWIVLISLSRYGFEFPPPA